MACSWTQEQLDALNAAIAEGALRVKYQDKEVEYRSLSDMLKLKQIMEDCLAQQDGGNNGGGRRMIGVWGSGL